MLPWGPPDTKFSTGTPKSQIGKHWNFAKLTHGHINRFHRVLKNISNLAQSLAAALVKFDNYDIKTFS